MRRSPSVVYWLGENLYLNITNKCSNNCYFCIRKFKSGVGNFNLKLPKDPSTEEILDELLKVLNQKNWREIVFCGFGETLERLDCLLEVARWIRKHYGKPIGIRVDTNGQGFLLNKNRDIITELKAAGVDKVSVSLNAHDKETYNQVCKPKFENAFENVLTFIEEARGKFDVEITAVTIPEVDLSRVAKIAQEIGVKFRVREHIPGFW